MCTNSLSFRSLEAYKSRCQTNSRTLMDELNCLRWPTRTEPVRRVEVRSGRASSASYPVWQSQAPAHYITPSYRPHSAAPSFSHFAFSLAGRSNCSGSRVLPRLRRARLRSPPPIRHNSSTTSSPATHRVHLCPLIAPSKLQRRASARRSSAATLCRRGPT